ncbi:ATP-binding protein [Clostridium drakei]|uniref:histidine kinase n=1 Tax=Clostridium drakei TaxID=332101 RepID=A0A2U8DT64_9CLOT|nr:ATP-binding protein [Clostridium drakei]AWI05973.1 two-component sensor histidine kinase [Clostridium drakei]
MFRKNITFKLTFGFLLIVIISTLLIGIISLNIFKNNIFNVKRSNMTRHALEISKTLKPYITEDIKGKEFTDIINLLDSIDNAKIWIVDSNKNIISASNNKSLSLTYITDTSVLKTYNSIFKKTLDNSKEYDEIYNPYYKEYMMTVSVPIKNNSNNVIGAVVINSSITDLSNSMNNFFIYLILTLLGEIFIAGLMGYYFSKNITTPIKKINSSALELAKGHYGILTNVYQKDEIGELSNSFDLLSLKLQYTINKLFEEKTKLSNIITSMNEGILAMDSKLNIININQSALSLLSLKDYESGLKINTVLSELNIIEEFEATIYEDTKKSILKKYLHKTLNFSMSPVKNNLNETIGGVILIQDVSEKEKLEQMRKDFVSNVSHEFRTPLTIIKGNLESVIDGMTKTEYIKDTCITLLKETNRLERMVKDLLNLSKLESGKLEIVFNELNINMLINDILRSLRPLIKNKFINLQLSLENNLPIISSDYDKLKQLLIIFLDNAIKFSSNEGILKISTYSDNKNIYIIIEDSGIGIPKNEIEYLGEKFFKADRARTSNVEGTGLGLSIAKRLVRILNGHFEIESELGKGTIITISFSKI